MNTKTYFELSNIQKTALLVIALGKNVAVEIIKYLSDDEIREIGYWIHRMPTASPEMLKNSVEEFYFRLNGKTTPTYKGGKEYFFEILKNSLGDQRAAFFLSELDRFEEKNLNLKNILSAANTTHLAELLAREASETVALLFCHQDEVSSADIFSKMPFKKQLSILMALAEFDHFDPATLASLIKQSREIYDSNFFEFESFNLNLSTIAVSILKPLDKSFRLSLLTEFEKYKPEFAIKINNQFFVDDELMFLSEAEIKDLFENFSPMDLVVALYESDDISKAKLLQFFSPEMIKKINSELLLQEPITPYTIQAAQKKLFYYLHQHKGISV